jgi:hypothetical protein
MSVNHSLSKISIIYTKKEDAIDEESIDVGSKRNRPKFEKEEKWNLFLSAMLKHSQNVLKTAEKEVVPEGSQEDTISIRSFINTSLNFESTPRANIGPEQRAGN